MRFDNGKVAYCGNKELRVYVPSGAMSVTSIEMVAFKELTGLKRLAIEVLDNPRDTNLKGELGEAITKERFMDPILDEISRRSGIPKDRLEVKHLGEEERGKEAPDFVIKIVGTDTRVAVVEVKYVGDIENVKNFKDQLDDAVEQVKERMIDPKWEAPHGVIVVIAWPPGADSRRRIIPR